MSITAESIGAAADRIAGRIRRTPVLEVEASAFGLSHGVALKLEHIQITGSFKVRGAFNTLLSQDHAGRDVVAISGGNHGAAVAYAATQLGLSSTIFVPKAIAKPEKVKRMERFGAEVRLVDGTNAEAFVAYEAHVAETGALAVHPYDSPETLAGQGTLGLEIGEQVPELDTVLLTVGGGGLFGGVASALAGRMRVVAVETEDTALLNRALREGPEVQILPGGIAASSLGASKIGRLAYDIAKTLGTESVVVPDSAVFEAGRRLWEDARLVVEPGAAAALAALVHGAYRPAPSERVGVVLCGGNADPDWFVWSDGGPCLSRSRVHLPPISHPEHPSEPLTKALDEASCVLADDRELAVSYSVGPPGVTSEMVRLAQISGRMAMNDKPNYLKFLGLNAAHKP